MTGGDLPGDPLSRRRLWRLAGLGLAGGSVALLAGCGGGEDRDAAGRPLPSPTDDAELLNSALDLEHMSVAAYGAGRGAGGRLVRELREHERVHVVELERVIRDLGGTPHAAGRRYDFPSLRSERDVLRFGAELEATAVAAYIDALPRLSQPELRGLAAAIMTVDAEHMAVLRDALGEEPVPDAFVTGQA